MIKSIILALFVTINYCSFSQNYDMSISGETNVDRDEGEAHIAINPADSNQMAVGFMELGPDGLSFKIYSSNDQGNTWQQSLFNSVNSIQNDYPTYSVIGGGDIVFAYDNDGLLYCSWINLLADLSLANPLDSCIWTAYWAKSDDNGITFTLENGTDHFFGRGKIGINGPVTIHNYEDGISDRQWMAVDCSNGPDEGNLYVAYINYPFLINNTGLKVKRKSAGQSAFSNAVTAYAGNGQLTNIGVDQNGVLHYTFADIASNQIYHVSSSDGGQTFSNPHSIYNGSNLFPQSNHKVNDRENAAPSLAIDGTNKLHLVWSDFLAGQDQITSYYASSDDGGINWSSIVNLETVFDDPVFMPVVSAKNNHVTIAGNVLDTAFKSGYYIASSQDNGQSFNEAIKVSTGITDFDSLGSDIFVGDYSSGIRTNCTIFSLWTDCRSNGCKQYISRYDECASLGLSELTPVQSTYMINRFYPNPVENNLVISIKSDIADRMIIEVYNALGQIQLTRKWDIKQGENEVLLDLDFLPNGHYIFKIKNSENTFLTRTFIK